MPFLKSSTIDKVHSLSIEDICQDYGLNLVRKGARMSCCCPFHSERTGSFYINPTTNRYHCFGCGADGSNIDFVMNYDNLSYYEAILALARKNNIQIDYEDGPDADKREEEYRKLESMRIAIASVSKFFVECFNSDSAEAAAARKYAESRWNKTDLAEFGMGYAPHDSRLLLEYVRTHCIDTDILVELGILGKSDRVGSLYSVFRDRLMFPIRNIYRQVIAFTARYTGPDPKIAKSHKYINSKYSPLFKKGEVVFGIDVAVKNAIKCGYFIIVEGAPDVLSLQSVGLANVVAPLGTALTEKQLNLLGRHCKTIRFIPDSDAPKPGERFGAGVNAVIKNGTLAMHQGFNVSVREIPRSEDDDKNEVKHDPDSYIKCVDDFDSLPDEPFPVWLAGKLFPFAATKDQQAKVVTEIAELVHCIEDSTLREMVLGSLEEIYKQPKLWKSAMRNIARREKESAKVTPRHVVDDSMSENTKMSSRELQLLRDNCIVIKDGCYQSYDKDGHPVKWSNFLLFPIVHIRGDDTGERLFRIVNQDGDEAVIELSSDHFVSLQKFQKKLINLGNYVWKVKIDQLIQLQGYLFGITETADKVKEMGWNAKYEYYAFANGICIDNKFLYADEAGIIRHGTNCFYLPIFSNMHKDRSGTFSFERQFKVTPGNGITLHEYTRQIVQVFGDGGKVAVAFALACIFRDIIFGITGSFPILNLFGQKASGKTSLAKAVASFFYTLKKDPPKLAATTAPALSYMLCHAINCVVVLDEYTNDLPTKTIEMIKGLWGGTAQTKMNMAASDQQMISIPVLSGVIFTGQQPPTKDIAVLSRCIYLYYSETKFTPEQRQNFKILRKFTQMGNQHLTMEVLKYRNEFEAAFEDFFNITEVEMTARLNGKSVEDRILSNWVTLLATVRTLEAYISLPFSYKEFLEVCVSGMLTQNEKVENSSETGDFWKLLDGLHMDGKAKEGCHYVIRSKTAFKPFGKKEEFKFAGSRKLIYLNWAAVKGLLSSRVNQNNRLKLDVDALDSYLHSMNCYYGTKQQRFTILLSNGTEDVSFDTENGVSVKKNATVRPMALVFDYDDLKRDYGINLETERVRASDTYDDEDDEDLAGSEVPSKSPTSPPVSLSEASLFPTSDQDDTPF